MATESDLRELLCQLEDGAPTVSSVLDTLAVDRPKPAVERPALDRPVPGTRYWRGWRVTGAAAACAAVILGVGAFSLVAHRDETGAGVTRPPTRAQSSTSGHSSASNESLGLSAADRALAVIAAHHAANLLAVAPGGRLVAGWPDGISAVTAITRPGTVTAAESNTGHACMSGQIIVVRLIGDFGDHTTGNLNAPANAPAGTDVREIDLSVDATTGLTCLSSDRTEPVPLTRDGSVLYRR